MYNKKVIQHFQNPKNMGKMKNPDAVAEVGNPVCLLPYEKVFLNDQFIEIKKADKKDFVLSHNGLKNEIIERYSRKFKGKVIKIKNALGKTSLTPEHLIFASKLPKHNNYFRAKYKKELIPSWYHAEQIEERDVIVYPIPKEIKDIKFIKVNTSKKKYDFKSKTIPKRLILNSELLRLFGYFLSEGNVQEKPCSTYITFALNLKEKELAKDIKEISKRLFDLDIVIRDKQERKTKVVYIYNVHLARFFKELFGNGAEHKKIPDFIMNLSPERQKALIKGLWLGDGYINLKRIGPRAGYSTISYQLAQQVKILLLRQKIVPSLYIDKERKINGVNHKESYRIHVGQRESLEKISKILGLKYSPKSYQSISSWFDNNFLYTPITKIKKVNYKGKVCNLEVKKVHSFVSEALLLHNCGDIMRIYIKVNNNKIKDISFETMGCVAAIATSSMITEMAKGKTLEQAKKISYNDVVKELGDLPLIKRHCADLASRALRLAIANYETKKKK